MRTDAIVDLSKGTVAGLGAWSVVAANTSAFSGMSASANADGSGEGWVTFGACITVDGRSDAGADAGIDVVLNAVVSKIVDAAVNDAVIAVLNAVVNAAVNAVINSAVNTVVMRPKMRL